MKSLIFLALFLTGCVTTEVTEEQLAKHYESAVLSKDGKIWKLRGPIDYRITYDRRDDYDRWEALIRRHLNEMEEPRWSDFPKGWFGFICPTAKRPIPAREMLLARSGRRLNLKMKIGTSSR